MKGFNSARRVALLSLFACSAAIANAPSQPTAAPANVTCQDLAREAAAIEKQLEAFSSALATSMAGHTTEAIATGTAHNAVNATSGYLNWVVPGLGTAMNLAADKAADAATKAREGRMAKEKATTTMTFGQASHRLAELDRLSQEMRCADRR